MRRVAILCCLAIVACEQPAKSPSPHLKVGLLTPGSINDHGWNAIAYEGLLRIQKELGAEISHQETRTPAEFEEGFRSYGAKGFNLAVGHGFEFQDAALKAGREYPKTVFLTTSGSSVAPECPLLRIEQESERSRAECHPGVCRSRRPIGFCLHGKNRSRSSVSARRWYGMTA